MPSNQFDALLAQANTAAQNSDWNKAIELLSQAAALHPEDSGIETGLGTCLMRLGQAAQAIPHFQKAARLASDSPEAHNNLGVGYMLNENFDMAEEAFKEALWLDEDNVQAWKNLAQVYLEQSDRTTEGVQILASIIQSNPNDIEALFQLALCYELGEDIVSAETLLNRILDLQPGHPQALEVLSDIAKRTSVSPISSASITLKPPAAPVPQSDRIARPEHAKKLASLKSLVNKPSIPVSIPQPAVAKTTKTAAFYSPDSFAGSERFPAIAAFWEKKGYKVQFVESFSPDALKQFDQLIFYSPNLSPQLIDGVNHCIQNQKSYAIDFDLDFFHIPSYHPAYAQFGPGNPSSGRVLEIMMNDAQFVTTASVVLTERLKPYARNVETALPAWINNTPWWNRPKPKHTNLHVGWMGTKADMGELEEIKPSLQKFFKENTQTTWVAVGDNEVYEMFPTLPEERRLFVPSPTKESLGLAFSNFDILLLPFRENEYNQARSDHALVYTGLQRSVWVASAVPAFQTWQEGGMIAKTQNDWSAHLNQLVKNTDLRQKLGEAGRKKAEAREFFV